MSFILRKLQRFFPMPRYLRSNRRVAKNWHFFSINAKPIDSKSIPRGRSLVEGHGHASDTLSRPKKMALVAIRSTLTRKSLCSSASQHHPMSNPHANPCSIRDSRSAIAPSESSTTCHWRVVLGGDGCRHDRRANSAGELPCLGNPVCGEQPQVGNWNAHSTGTE